MWPRRRAEIVPGGSLYWVIRGLVLARQPVLGFEEAVGADAISRCAIVLDPVIRRTAARPRGPFQGWRYLRGADAPPDLPEGMGGGAEGELPVALARALSELGLTHAG